MSTILEEICAHKLRELDTVKQAVPPRELYTKVERIMDLNTPNLSLSRALTNSATGIISEFKRKSPSKGWINQQADPTIITPAYEKAGATALSILTNEHYFGGSLDDIRSSRPKVSIPILRKEFVVDEYQIFEAKEVGANAVLLIAACLTKDLCKALSHIAHELDLEVLLEIHTEPELDYITPDINVVGVNNRNLHVFKTDIKTSVELASKIPQEFVKISESGLSTPDDIKSLRLYGYKGFLMGERFMKNTDPAAELASFINAVTAGVTPAL